MATLETSAAVGVTGFAVFQLASFWQATAPSLEALRDAPVGDWHARQKLLDADILVGGTALLAGGVVSYLTRTWLPVALASLAFLMLSSWYHSVCNSAHEPY